MPAPIAVDDVLSIGADTPFILNIADLLLANDTDPDGDPLSLDSFGQPANGTLVDNGNGTLTYTPNPGFIGVDTFSYIASDGTFQSNQASVTLEVGLPGGIASDDFSGAGLDAGWTVEGPAGTVNLAASPGESYLEIALPDGDYDLWGGYNNTKRVMQATTDENFGVEAKFLSTPSGAYQIQGILIEQDADNWIRFDVYSDGSQLHVFAAATIGGSATSVFDNVVAGAPYLRVDRTGDNWTFQHSVDGQNWVTAGALTQALAVTSTGVFAGSTGASTGYTAQVDYFSNTAAPIAQEDPPPVALNDTVSTDIDTPLVLDVAADLLANDSDPNGALLTLTGFTQPSNGTVTDNGNGTFTYAPNAGYVGIDSFTYTVSDGADSDTATVSVEIANPASAPPTAQDDAVNTNEDAAIVVAVLANDSDPDSDPLTLTGFTQGANGTVTDNGDGTVTYTPNADFSGADSFTYTITDGVGYFDTATVNVTVDPVNDAPVAQNDAASTGADTAVVLDIANDLLGNDTDIDGGVLTLDSFNQPANGTLVDNGNGTLTYTPDTGFIGIDTFTYAASDGAAQSNQASVSIEVGLPGGITSDDFSGAGLDAGWSVIGPAGTAGLAASTGESYLEIALPDGDYNLWSGYNNTKRVMQATADEDFGVETRFLSTPSGAYQIQGLLIEQDADNWIRFDVYSDGTQLHVFGAANIGGSTNALFDQTVSAADASHLRIDRVGDNWTFERSSDGQTWVTVGTAALALAVTSTGVFAGSTGASTGFTAQVDYFFNSAAPLAQEDPAPVAQDDTVSTDLDTPVVVNVASDLLVNDSDPNGASLTLTGFTQPANGTLTDNGNGTLTYTPNAGFIGADSFTYTVSDGADSDTATVSVGVTDASNTAPTAQGDIVSTSEDSPTIVAVLANDTDPDSDPLVLTGFSQAANGTVTDNGDGTVTYTPNADFTGADSFTYTITDGHGYFDTATVNITVDPVNDAPVAQDDAVTTNTDVAVILNIANDILGNDTDAEGNPITLASFEQPANGTLVDNANGTLTYTPNAGFIGVDTFGYVTSDGTAQSNQANVSIEVGLPGGIASDDFSGAGLNAGWVEQGPAGTVNLATSPGESYLEIVLPAGDYNLWAGYNNTKRVMQATTDEDFGVETKFLSTPSAAFQLQGILIEQDANNWIRFDIYSDGSRIHVFAAANVGGNMTSVFDQIVTSASHLRVDRSGDTWTFEHSVDGQNWVTAGVLAQALAVTSTGVFAGSTDGSPGFTSQVDYFFNSAAPITQEDPPPVAGDDAVSTDVDTPLVLDVAAQLLANDSDPAGALLSLTGFTQPANGTLTDNGNGTLTYTPNAGYIGADSFTYTISDGADSDTATVVVGVADPNSVAPVAQDDTVNTNEDTSTVVAVLANDSDTDGDPLTLTGFTQAANGTVTDNGDGTVTYTPDADYNGADNFTYTITDGRGYFDTATVNVTVDSVNDAPVAVEDTVTTDADTGVILNIANDVLGNDTDAEGDPLTLASFSQPANGTLVDNGNGTLTYTPNTGFIGVDTFGYTASDGTAPSNPGNVRIEVGLPGGIASDDFSGSELGGWWSEQGPAGTVDFGTSSEDSYLEIVLPAGDYDAYNVNTTKRVMQAASDEDFEVEARFLTAPSEQYQMQGILIEQDANNWIRFDILHTGSTLQIYSGVTIGAATTPAIIVDVSPGSASYLKVNRTGDDWSLLYSADGTNWTTAGSFTHALTVTAAGVFAGSTGGSPGYAAQVDYFFNTAAPISPEDDLPSSPVAQDDIAVTGADTPVVLDVTSDLLANDSDPNGDPLLFDGFDQPANGTLTDNGNGTLTYTPDPGFAGVDSFTYTISDGTGTPSDTASVFVGVNNTGPVGQNDVTTTDEDIPVIVAVLANDSDANGDNLIIASVTEPANGTIVINPDGTLTYTPNADFNGVDSVIYTVTDGVASNTATVDFTINPVADAPDAGDDAFSVLPDTSLVISISNDLLINDTDADNDPVLFNGFQQPAHGTLVDNGNGTLTYTPNAGYEGVDSFTYDVTDGSLTGSATVDLTISDAITVWYGDVQQFGSVGEGQDWINILGNVDLAQVASMSYSLNGGIERALSLGPDTRRLQENGDFNVDISYDELDGSAVDDVVTIRANLVGGGSVTKDVTINYLAGNSWPSNYSIDWSTVTNIQDAVQVVDGLWSYDANGIRPTETGYDRLLAIGDNTWDNYEVSLSITMHDVTSSDPYHNVSGALGLGMLWNGHTDDPVSGFQPKAGYVPISSFVFWNGDVETRASNFTDVLDTQPFLPQAGTTYEFKFRIEQVNVLDRLYSIKVWEEGTAEPTDWYAQSIEQFAVPSTGAFAPFIHYWDVTLGDITVTEIEGNDIVPGKDTDDIIVAVDTGQVNPGQGETDVLMGGAGSDTFVFGEAGTVFYDDGNSATDGVEDYALIWDFETGVDTIFFTGSQTDYTLANSPTGLHTGTAIYRVEPGETDELIGILNDVFALTLDNGDFVFDDAIV